jgi:hypothetical protein
VINEEDEKEFDERLGQLLPPDVASWLVGGNGEGDGAGLRGCDE